MHIWYVSFVLVCDFMLYTCFLYVVWCMRVFLFVIDVVCVFCSFVSRMCSCYISLCFCFCFAMSCVFCMLLYLSWQSPLFPDRRALYGSCVSNRKKVSYSISRMRCGIAKPSAILWPFGSHRRGRGGETETAIERQGQRRCGREKAWLSYFFICVHTVFIEFHRFSLFLIEFHWFLMIFKDFNDLRRLSYILMILLDFHLF